MPMAGPRAMGTRENVGFSGARTSKSLKKSRAARAKDGAKDHRFDHRYRDFANDAKSEDHAKMTHSISDFGGRLRA